MHSFEIIKQAFGGKAYSSHYVNCTRAFEIIKQQRIFTSIVSCDYSRVLKRTVLKNVLLGQFINFLGGNGKYCSM